MNAFPSKRGHFFQIAPVFKHLLAAATTALVVICSGCQTPEIEEVPFGPENPERIAQIQGQLESFLAYWRARGQFYGMTVGVVKADKLVYKHETGMTQDRKYALGSITKIFTATAVMKLVEEGAVDLDAPLTDYMEVRIERPELSSRPVTIRHLLSHTSGMPDLRYFHPELIASPELPFRIPPQIVPAGMHYRYSNTGFMILGEMVSRRSGKPMDQFMREEIFEPLEMRQTKTSQLTGASGVATTIEDLSHFAMMYLNHGKYGGKTILSEETVNRMLTQPVYYPPAEFQEYCGLGWRVKRGPKGVVTFFHIGGADYIAAWLQLFPRYRMAILYLGDPPKYDDYTMGMLLALQAKLGDLATAYAGADTPLYLFKATPPPPEVFETYPGTYINVLTGREAVVTAKNDVLFFSRAGTYAYPLGTQTNHVFTGGFQDLSHDFVHEPGTNKLLGIAAYDGYYVRKPPEDTDTQQN